MGRKKPEITPSVAKRASSRAAEDAHFQTGFGCDGGGERGPVGGVADRLGAHDVEFRDAHRVGDRAKPAQRLDGAAKSVRRDRAGLCEPFAEPAERFFVEARQRRARELVIDDQPHRIRADVDDRVMRLAPAAKSLGIDVERARGGLARRCRVPGHRAIMRGLPFPRKRERPSPLAEEGVAPKA